MSYLGEYASFHAALDPHQPEPVDRWAGWVAVAKIAAVCAAALLLFVGPLSDAGIAAGSTSSPYVSYCHSTPERKAWCEWQAFMAEPRNRAWYALRVHFGDGWLADQAVRIGECESRLNPNAVSDTNDHGTMQINRPSWERKFSEVTGQPWSAVYDPDANARFARWLYDATGGWSHWACRGAA